MKKPPTESRFAAGLPDRGLILVDHFEVSYDLEAGSRRDEKWAHDGLIDLRQCPRCRYTLRESLWKYCGRCGLDLAALKTAQAGSSANAKGLIIGAIVLVLGLIALFSYRLQPVPAPTVTLSAEPSTVEKGKSVTLNWAAQNVTELDLEPAIGKVQAPGSSSVVPQDSGTYTLTATGPGGMKKATAYVTVTIPARAIPPPIPGIDPKAPILGLMNDWIEAFKSQNAGAMAVCYAPSVELFFKRRNFSNNQVRSSLEGVFSTTAEIHQYEITDIHIIPFVNGRYIATFEKTWDVTKTNGRPFSGAEIDRLTFAKFNSSWKIVREEEIRILRVLGRVG